LEGQVLNYLISDYPVFVKACLPEMWFVEILMCCQLWCFDL